jgi:hypothetical protein
MGSGSKLTGYKALLLNGRVGIAWQYKSTRMTGKLRTDVVAAGVGVGRLQGRSEDRNQQTYGEAGGLLLVVVVVVVVVVLRGSGGKVRRQRGMVLYYVGVGRALQSRTGGKSSSAGLWTLL